MGCQTSIYIYIFGQLSCDYGAVTGRGILSNGLFFFLVGYGSSKRMWLNKTNRVGLWVVKEGGWVMVCTTNGEIEWGYLQRDRKSVV